jgi:hypothetical protein
MLNDKFLRDWENLDFLKSFWNPIYDDKDLFQYRRTAHVWRMRRSGETFNDISKKLGVDQRKACAIVSGKNLHPYLVQMYLISEMLHRPRDGWKWVLQCTPKPTNMLPKAYAVPEKIRSYQDIVDFLNQFPQVPAEHPAIRFFGLSSEWVVNHKLELFGFLLGFTVGDAGKGYPEYEYRSRHYRKTAITTNMAMKESNKRILRYVQLCLTTVGIPSHRNRSRNGIIRWNSEASNIITWILRVCVGLKEGQRTSRNPIEMSWLSECPREFVFAFFQGLAESNGSMNKHGYYAEIGSIPNSLFLKELLDKFNIASRVHPKDHPTSLRLNLTPALQIPLFHPIIASYRYRKMISHARRRKILPPLPPFFMTRYRASLNHFHRWSTKGRVFRSDA